MACTPSRLLANQLNAQKSTGPRTGAGKQRASMNATTHGVFCSETVVHGESRQMFEALREAFLAELSPQDPIELLLVDEIVMNQWKLRRLRASEGAFFDSEVHALKTRVRDSLKEDDLQGACEAAGVLHDPYMAAIAMMADLKQNHSVVDRYSRLEQRLMNNIYRALRELRALRKAKGTDKEPLPVSPYQGRQTIEDAEAEMERAAAAKIEAYKQKRSAARKAKMQNEPNADKIQNEPNDPAEQSPKVEQWPTLPSQARRTHGDETLVDQESERLVSQDALAGGLQLRPAECNQPA